MRAILKITDHKKYGLKRGSYRTPKKVLTLEPENANDKAIIKMMQGGDYGDSVNPLFTINVCHSSDYGEVIASCEKEETPREEEA